MKVVLNVVKFILMICLVMCLILGVYVKVFSNTILSKDYTFKQLEDNNYYDDIYDEIETNFEKYIAQSGLDEEVLNNIVTKDMVKSDINKLIDAAYDGENVSIDTASLRKNLKNNIDDSLKNTYISSSTQTAIDDFIDKIIKEYEDTMLHSRYVKNINQLYEQVMELVEILNIGLVVTIVVFVLCLIVLNIKHINKFLYDIGISGVSTGLFVLIANIIINNKVKIEYIKVLNDSVSRILVNIIKNIMENLNLVSIVFIVIGMILIVFSAIVQTSKKEMKG